VLVITLLDSGASRHTFSFLEPRHNARTHMSQQVPPRARGSDERLTKAASEEGTERQEEGAAALG